MSGDTWLSGCHDWITMMLLATLFATLLVAAVSDLAAGQSCYVSSGVLTLYHTPPWVLCVQRSDVPYVYSVPTGDIASPFVYGALVNPPTLPVNLTFFLSSQCVGYNYTVPCVVYPPSFCALDLGDEPILFNVGPPTSCIKRVDTHTTIPVDIHTTPKTINLGVPVNPANCPISVSPMRYSDCTTYLHSGPVSCPCPSGCISTSDFSNTFPANINGNATVLDAALQLTSDQPGQGGSLYFDVPVPYDAMRRSFASYTHIQIDPCTTSCTVSIGVLVLQTSGPAYVGKIGDSFFVLNGGAPLTDNTHLLALGLHLVHIQGDEDIGVLLGVYTTLHSQSTAPLGGATFSIALNTTDLHFWMYYDYTNLKLMVFMSRDSTRPINPLFTLDSVDINSSQILGTSGYFVGYSGATDASAAPARASSVVSAAFCSCKNGDPCNVEVPMD